MKIRPNLVFHQDDHRLVIPQYDDHIVDHNVSTALISEDNRIPARGTPI